MKLVTLLITSLMFQPVSIAIDPFKWHKNPVIAHRGAWKKKGLPENSIAALREAISLKCYGSEFDVHLTADSVVVVNHDADFKGMHIEESTYAQLLTQQLSNGEKIPTLEQYLAEGMKQKGTKLILEMKPSAISKERGQALAEKCINIVRKMKAQRWVEYISFDYDIVKKAHLMEPKAPVSYLEGNKTPEQLKADGISGFDYHYSVFKKNTTWLEDARVRKITTNAWTVNTLEDMEWLLNSKIDFITTNEPELLLDLLKK